MKTVCSHVTEKALYGLSCVRVVEKMEGWRGLESGRRND